MYNNGYYHLSKVLQTKTFKEMETGVRNVLKKLLKNLIYFRKKKEKF